MRFLLDENFPVSAAAILSALGHQVDDIRGSDAEGCSDKEIFELAQERQAVFLTTDRDFFHTIPHLYPRHHGAIVIALRQPNRQAIIQRLEWILGQHELQPFQSKVIQLRDRSYIIRRQED